MKLSAKMTEEQDDQQIVSEWRFAAMVNIDLVIFKQDFYTNYMHALWWRAQDFTMKV